MPLRKTTSLLVAMWVWVSGAVSAADYDLGARLDPGSGRIRVAGSVRWTNHSSAATGELWLHLYLNAFAGPRTTFMRELYDDWWWGEEPWPEDDGWIRLERLATEDGVDLLQALVFTSPDDGNPDDRTVARVPLPREVLPGGSVRLEMEYEAQLPTLLARSGSAGDFHMAAQWFPKVGVLEEGGAPEGSPPRWSCHQYHQDSEFYADFGRYRVEITVPGGWVVGATGVESTRQTVSEVDGEWQRLTFVADRVHDFAWCAAPEEAMAVVEEEFDPALHVPQVWVREASRRLQMSTGDLELPSVHLRLLVPRSQVRHGARVLEGVRLAMAWLGLRYGPYPYPQLTVVCPPPGAEGAGAMEYPTLITVGIEPWQRLVPRGWDVALMGLVAHELAHQTFYGVLAFNEAESAWLDEGLASYAEAVFLSELAAEGRLRSLVPMSPWTGFRHDLMERPLPLRIDRRAWDFRRSSDYAAATYGKAALVLRTLEGLIGGDAFAQGLRQLVEDHRWSHPTGHELRRSLEAASGQDLGWFFDQAVTSDATADWAVLEARSRRSGPGDGAAGEPAGQGWESHVDVGRPGEVIGPVEVEVGFADGTTARRVWEGPERWVRWRFTSRAPVTRVVVDPDGVWALEVSRLDNRWTSPQVGTGSLGSLWWLRAAVRVLGLPLLPWS